MKRAFKIILFLLIKSGVFAADEDEIKSMAVMEGDSVTLRPDPAKIQGFVQIQWRFGDLVIAEIDGKYISYPPHTEIFRDRLHLDQTGSLTIKNMKIKHSGLYILQIDHSSGTLHQKFSVTVFESPVVIDADEAEIEIMLVMEGDHVTLHVPQLQDDELIVWRFGYDGKLIAKHDIEAKSPPLYYETDERFRDRLKLDQTGSLTITNTRNTDSGLYTAKISNNKMTLYKRFIITVHDCCGFTEAVIRLVLSALVGVATVAVLVYDIRSRNLQQKQTSPKDND